jgi:hypothetical protein
MGRFQSVVRTASREVKGAWNRLALVKGVMNISKGYSMALTRSKEGVSRIPEECSVVTPPWFLGLVTWKSPCERLS